MTGSTVHDAVRTSTSPEQLRDALTAVLDFVAAVENREYADPLTIAATIRHKIYSHLNGESDE